MSSPDFPFLTAREERVILAVRLVPRSKKNRLAGIHDGRLKIAVTAPPVEGKANQGLLEFLAKLLDCPKSAVSIEQGELNREKLVAIRGVPVNLVAARLDEALSKT